MEETNISVLNYRTAEIQVEIVGDRAAFRWIFAHPLDSPLLYSSGALYVAKILRIHGNFRLNDVGWSGFEKFSGVCPRVTAFNFVLRSREKTTPDRISRYIRAIIEKRLRFPFNNFLFHSLPKIIRALSIRGKEHF